jgi:hypothetical protein
VNGFTGKRRGYLSSNTYLMMLVNYLQTQCLMPNIQDMKLIANPDEIPVVQKKYLHNEKLTSDERARYSRDLTEINLDRMNTADL